MNDRSLSVYVKKWIIVFIVNKLNFIYFTWFVYTFVNYKYNVFLKRDDVCLIPLRTLVTLSRFDEGKEIRIVCSKMAQKSNAKCCGNVKATLCQRLDNIGERHCHKVGNRRRHNSHFRPCHNVVTTSTMTCWPSWVCFSVISLHIRSNYSFSLIDYCCYFTLSPCIKGATKL